VWWITSISHVCVCAAGGRFRGSFGATLRQSELGFEAFGPTVAGAKTRADLQLDLAGGFPFVPNGVDSGLMRLRTATMRMDWTDTSVVVGQDAIFFSPTSPTSFASLAIPALSGAETCGLGFRRYEWSTEWLWANSRVCYCRQEF